MTCKYCMPQGICDCCWYPYLQNFLSKIILSSGCPQRLRCLAIKENERPDCEIRVKKQVLTKKEKYERYREKLKADPEAYELFILKERERAKKYRKWNKTPEQISHERELNRLQSKRYRYFIYQSSDLLWVLIVILFLFCCFLTF